MSIPDQQTPRSHFATAVSHFIYIFTSIHKSIHLQSLYHHITFHIVQTCLPMFFMLLMLSMLPMLATIMAAPCEPSSSVLLAPMRAPFPSLSMLAASMQASVPRLLPPLAASVKARRHTLFAAPCEAPPHASRNDLVVASLTSYRLISFTPQLSHSLD